MSCHNCIGVDIAGLRKRLDEQLRENDRLLAVIGVLTRGQRHEDAERAVGAHLRVDETPGAVPEKLQEE